jgi:hypothetical protein
MKQSWITLIASDLNILIFYAITTLSNRLLEIVLQYVYKLEP